jgi:hypothetical protein
MVGHGTGGTPAYTDFGPGTGMFSWGFWGGEGAGAAGSGSAAIAAEEAAAFMRSALTTCRAMGSIWRCITSGTSPDRVLDQTEPAVLGVEPGVQLGKLVTHPGAQGVDVGGGGFVEVDAGHGFHANCGKKLRLMLMISATTTPATTTR